MCYDEMQHLLTLINHNQFRDIPFLFLFICTRYFPKLKIMIYLKYDNLYKQVIDRSRSDHVLYIFG